MPADQPDQDLPLADAEASTRRQAILEAIGRAAAILNRASQAEDVNPEFLESLGRAVGACGVVLDRYRPGPDGEVYSVSLAHWRDPAAPPPTVTRPAGPVPLVRIGLGPFLEILRRGEPFDGCPDDCAPPLRDMLVAWNVRSFLAVPIKADGRLIGLLALAQCRTTRTWRPLEKDALRIYADMIGSFLQRLEAGQALRHSEERYRQVVESSSEFVWEADIDSRVTYCSDRLEEVLGYRPEEVLGKPPFWLLHSDDASESIERVRDATERQVGFQAREARAISATGQIVWISVTATPIFDEGGALIGYRGATADITARKRAESTLRASEERYRGLVESQHNILVRWTPDLRLSFGNEAYFRTFGFEREATIGRPILEHVRPESVEAIRRLFEKLTNPPFQVAHAEFAMTAAGRRCLSWESSPIHDESGRIVEYQGIGRDVTAERYAAEELRRTDRILEAVNAAAERLVESLDWENVIADVMRKLGQAIGASRARLWQAEFLEDGGRVLHLRADWSDPACPPLADPHQPGPLFIDRPEFRDWVGADATDRVIRLHADGAPEPLREVIANQGVRTLLAIPIRLDGAFWGCFIMSHPADTLPWSRTEEEALQAAARIFSGLVHRQRIRTSLRESEEKYRTLVEGARQPIILVEYDGTVRFANGFAARSLGLSPELMVGRTIWDLFPHEYADRHLAAIRRAMDSDHSVISTARSVTRGRPGWFEARIQPLAPSPDGTRTALVIIADISERKETERRIVEYQSRLRTLSSELALAEQRERRRIASELHDRIGQTLAMARIKLGGLQNGPDDPTLGEVRTLLDQSIQDTRTLTFELSPPILHELGLAPALEWLLERYHARHDFQTSFHGDGQPVKLPGDILGLVFQSVQELLVNIAKHARARSVSITLDRDQDYLHVEVADDGIGTTPARAARTGRSPGGFGLFNIRERIESLGGSFSFESQSGRGTRAMLQVPLHPNGRAPRGRN